MFGSSILEVAIGLVFVYLLMSLVCSAVNEAIESVLKNRATDLERGLQTLFEKNGEGQITTSFYNHPLISGLFRGEYNRKAGQNVGFLDYLWPTNLPSYIPAADFAHAVLDIVLHPPPEKAVQGGTPHATANAATAVNVATLPISMDALRPAIKRTWGHSEVGRALRTLAEHSGNDINAMRANVEAWFNSSMDRVSGTYKRRTHRIILFLGFILAVALNINTITLVKNLSTDATLRNVIVAQAQAFANRPDALKANLDDNRKDLEGLGLPIGWPSGINFVHPLYNKNFSAWDNVLMPLIGWLLTAAAISLGAPFWFDLLNKFMVIRATVKPHEKSLEEGSEDRQQRSNAAFIALDTGREEVPPAGTSGVLSSVPFFTDTPEPDLAAAPDPPDNESEIDGCDVPIEDVTRDEELPLTEGGVA
jgi:hypothetical protein